MMIIIIITSTTTIGFSEHWLNKYISLTFSHIRIVVQLYVYLHTPLRSNYRYVYRHIYNYILPTNSYFRYKKYYQIIFKNLSGRADQEDAEGEKSLHSHKT